MSKQLTLITTHLRKGLYLTKEQALSISTHLPEQVLSAVNNSSSEELSADVRQHVMSILDLTHWLNRDGVNEIKSLYTGRRIELVKMFDTHGIENGACGVVDMVDDAGQLSMKWDNGRTLNVNFDAGDLVRLID